MPKGRKRKTGPSDTASKSIKQSQISNVYSPVTRRRAHGLSALKLQLMHDAFLINDNILWERTSNCKVCKVCTDGCIIRLLRRQRPGDRKGE